MENKKLLKYLLKDLGELDEMFSEKDKNSFDGLEMEFIQNRISGAKKLIQLIIDHTGEVPVEKQPVSVPGGKSGIQKSLTVKEETVAPPFEKLPGNRWVEADIKDKALENEAEAAVNDVIYETKPEIKIQGTLFAETTGIEVDENAKGEVGAVLTKIEAPQDDNQAKKPVQGELQLEEDTPVDIHNKRLGDSFSKEKSVNDLLGDDFSKLEHKLSNRPVTSIQAAIGINDRFQYIRELFEGSAENFTKTVADLDSMYDIKEAVNYLQDHFKWKKNETSLKFVNLIKRRFPNE